MIRRLALVSGHFPPSNLVGAQRARLWSRYLPEFGWEPVVVTGDPAQYEARPDPHLDRLVPPGLKVVHANTLPTRPARPASILSAAIPRSRKKASPKATCG